MTQENRTAPYQCHCCASYETRYVQHYVLRRSLAVAAMYLCQSCRSISIDHEAVRRHYPRSNSKDAIEFHRRIRPRNEKWAATLLEKLRAQGADFTTVIDIGCGSGTLLSVAASQKLHAVGYEVDALALAEARLDPRLVVRDELFTRRSEGYERALVCCIAVLEHLYRPAALLTEIAEYSKKYRAAAFVFVPTLPEEWSKYLEESVHAAGNPFFDNEEHISHFSDSALTASWKSSFGREPTIVTSGGWRGYYCDFRL